MVCGLTTLMMKCRTLVAEARSSQSMVFLCVSTTQVNTGCLISSFTKPLAFVSSGQTNPTDEANKAKPLKKDKRWLLTLIIARMWPNETISTVGKRRRARMRTKTMRLTPRSAAAWAGQNLSRTSVS